MVESSRSGQRMAPFESLGEALSALTDCLSNGAPTLALGEALLIEGLAIVGAHEGRAVLAERLRTIADEIDMEGS